MRLVCLAVGLLLAARGAAAHDLQHPVSVAAAESGIVFVADRRLPGIWKLNGSQLEIYVQGTRTLRTPLNAIRGIALDRQGRLLACDSATRDIYRIDAAGQTHSLTRAVDSDNAGAAAAGLVGVPIAVAVSRAGEIYVSDLETGRVLRLAPGQQPVLVARISGCRGLFIDSQDNLWVVSTTADQLHRISNSGDREVVVSGRVFDFPHAVVVDAQGTIYVSDGFGSAIWRIVDQQPPQRWVAGPPLKNPVGMTLHQNKLLVADSGARAIFQIDTDGQLSRLEAE